MPVKKLLTLAIPTYNRYAILEKALGIIQPQLESLKGQIEYIVSDNCSPDNTQDVVKQYIDTGMPIQYIRNESNIGIMRNIIQCYKMATAKYVWVLGDDDYITENALFFVINILQNDSNQYGLLFHSTLLPDQTGFTVYTDKKRFFWNIDQSLIWISGSILNTKHVTDFDFEKHKVTWEKDLNISGLLDVNAVRYADYNIIIHERIFARTAVDVKTSGGYNFMILASGLILLSRKIADEFNMPCSYTRRFKKKLFKQYISILVEFLLFAKGKLNYDLKGAWTSLFKYYWGSFYLYTFLIYCFIKYKTKLYGMIRKAKNTFLLKAKP
jgi:glycosyltransferase involved in cell wall biosynthesis